MGEPHTLVRCPACGADPGSRCHTPVDGVDTGWTHDARTISACITDPDKPNDDAQRADHYQHLYEAASAGHCGYSGLELRECKQSICDCFDFQWVPSCPCGCPDDLHIGEVGCPCGMPDEPPCAPSVDSTPPSDDELLSAIKELVGTTNKSKTRRRYMWLDDLLRDYRDGDERGWEAEFAWLAEHRTEELERVIASVREVGMREPILLGNDGRVWDGHHRIAAAHRLGIGQVPVRYAAKPGRTGALHHDAAHDGNDERTEA